MDAFVITAKLVHAGQLILIRDSKRLKQPLHFTKMIQILHSNLSPPGTKYIQDEYFTNVLIHFTEILLVNV